jgi:hypothetical protein
MRSLFPLSAHTPHAKAQVQGLLRGNRCNRGYEMIIAKLRFKPNLIQENWLFAIFCGN